MFGKNLRFTQQHRILQHAHDFEPGIVPACQHTGNGGPAAGAQAKGTVIVLIQNATELSKPANGFGSVIAQGAKKIRVVVAVSAHIGVSKMPAWRVIGSKRCLDSALGHNGIGVAQPEFCGEMDGKPNPLQRKCGRCPCPAAAKDQHISFNIH